MPKLRIRAYVVIDDLSMFSNLISDTTETEHLLTSTGISLWITVFVMRRTQPPTTQTTAMTMIQMVTP